MVSKTYQVAADSDDCYVRYNDNIFTLTDAPTAGYWDGNAYKIGCGLRFTAVDIPKGAHINSAKITLTGYAVQSQTGVKTRIQYQNADNPTTLVDYANWIARLLSVTYVPWDIDAQWIVDGTYDSPDITALIQEIVNRSGWASGNALVICWNDFNNETPSSSDEAVRSGKSYSTPTNKGAKLTVDFSTSTPPGSGTEDFTSANWIEVDPNSHIGVTASTVTSNGINRNEDCYISRDMGANQISDFSYDFDFKQISAPTDNAFVVYIALTNKLQEFMSFTADECICLYAEGGANINSLILGNNDNTRAIDTALTKGTVYYATLKRSGGTVTCDIYSDSGRTTKLITLTLGASLSTAYRYVMLLVSANISLDEPTANPDGYVANLKLGGTTPIPPPPSPSGSLAVFDPPLFNLV